MVWWEGKETARISEKRESLLIWGSPREDRRGLLPWERVSDLKSPKPSASLRDCRKNSAPLLSDWDKGLTAIASAREKLLGSNHISFITCVQAEGWCYKLKIMKQFRVASVAQSLLKVLLSHGWVWALFLFSQSSCTLPWLSPSLRSFWLHLTLRNRKWAMRERCSCSFWAFADTCCSVLPFHAFSASYSLAFSGSSQLSSLQNPRLDWTRPLS